MKKVKQLISMLIIVGVLGGLGYLYMNRCVPGNPLAGLPLDTLPLPPKVMEFLNCPNLATPPAHTADNSGATKPNTAPAQPTTEEKKMANYDLTPDAEGLSKAVATLTLEKGGVMKWRFYTNDALVTVKRISQLISEGFYNGIVIHRVVPGFVVQAGDPTGTGGGGSGVKLKAEFNSRKHELGIISMARTSDPNSADSQFFIMLGTHKHLDGQYTIIGKTMEGVEIAQGIKQGDKIKSFTIQ